jgi:hypothetical protein
MSENIPVETAPGPGPTCGICGCAKPDSIRVEVAAWTEEGGTFAARTMILGRNVCLDCLTTVNLEERLIAGIIGASEQWFASRKRKQKPKPAATSVASP